MATALNLASLNILLNSLQATVHQLEENLSILLLDPSRTSPKQVKRNLIVLKRQASDIQNLIPSGSLNSISTRGSPIKSKNQTVNTGTCIPSKSGPPGNKTTSSSADILAEELPSFMKTTEAFIERKNGRKKKTNEGESISSDSRGDHIWRPPNSIKHTAEIRESKTDCLTLRPNEKTFKSAKHLTDQYTGQYRLATSSLPPPIPRFGPHHSTGVS